MPKKQLEWDYLFALAPGVLVSVEPSPDGRVKATVMPVEKPPRYYAYAWITTDADGAPIADQVEFHPHTGAPGGLTTADLRIPLTRLIDRAWAVATAIRNDAFPADITATQWMDGRGLVAFNAETLDRLAKRPRQVARVRPEETDALMARAVEAYRAAVRRKDPSPTATIAAELGYSRAHIGRLLVEARRRKMLAPARPGRAGEAPAARKRRKS